MQILTEWGETKFKNYIKTSLISGGGCPFKQNVFSNHIIT